MIRLRVASLMAVLVAAGCSSRNEPGPPTVHYGEDVCELCGMIISEERFAAAIVEAGPNGGGRSRHALLFDDIGDMVAHLDEEGGEVEGYVHDFATREWIESQRAWYTWSESLSTPMASGLAAFADRAAAQRHVETFPGEVLSWSQVLQGPDR